MNQRVARLEQIARQPRLAMEADGPADPKTRERTEGAAKAVQAKHRDSCTAQRVQDGPKISTCFGVMVEPPLSLAGMTFWSRTALWRPSRVSHPWRRAHQQPLVVHFPTGKASIATRTTLNQPPLRLYSTKETNSKKTSTP